MNHTRPFSARWALAGIMFALVGCGGDTPRPKFIAAFHEFAIPVSGNLPGAGAKSAWPDDIAGDADGNVWFAMLHANEIGRMTPDGAYKAYPVATAHPQLDCILVDSAHQTVWASEIAGNKIVRLDMDTGVTAEIPVPTPNAFPGDLALAGDGTLWFVEGYDTAAVGAGRIGKLNPATNVIEEIAAPSVHGKLDGILADSLGTVWICEFADSRIARYKGGAFTEFKLPRPNSFPTNIAIDKAGRLWVSVQAADELARFDPNTNLWTEYALPTVNASPGGIAVDSAGNVWFTEFVGNKIGVLRAGSSHAVDFAIPTADSFPEDVRQVGNRICFSERYGNKIGWISVPGITP